MSSSREIADICFLFILLYPTLYIIMLILEKCEKQKVVEYIYIEKENTTPKPVQEDKAQDVVDFVYVAPVKYTKPNPPMQKKKVGESTFKPAKPNPLIDDSIQCLVALGVKRPDAKKQVAEMFANHHYVSVEDFLVHYYQKQ